MIMSGGCYSSPPSPGNSLLRYTVITVYRSIPFFSSNRWPSLIICIDLFVFFFNCKRRVQIFFLKEGIRLKKSYEVRLYHYLDLNNA